MGADRSKRLDPETKAHWIRRIMEGETTQSAAAMELGVSRQAVSMWIKNHKAGKAPGRAGRPRRHPGVFSKTDRRIYRQMLRLHPPSAKGLDSPDDRWTPALVQQLIQTRSGISLPLDHCAELLERPDKPRAPEAPPEPAPPIVPEEEAIEKITEADLAPYLEKINEAHKKMKRPPIAPLKTKAAGTKAAKKKRKAQRKARKRNRK